MFIKMVWSCWYVSHNCKYCWEENSNLKNVDVQMLFRFECIEISREKFMFYKLFKLWNRWSCSYLIFFFYGLIYNICSLSEVCVNIWNILEKVQKCLEWLFCYWQNVRNCCEFISSHIWKVVIVFIFLKQKKGGGK